MFAQQQQLRACRGAAALPLLPARIAVHRSRKAVQRTVCAAAEAIEAHPTSSYDDDEPIRAFPYPMPMEPMQKTLVSIPIALFYPAVVACAAGAGFLTSLAGRAIPVEHEAKEVASVGAGAVVGAGLLYAGIQAKKKRDAAAVIDLYNTIVDLPEPHHLTPDHVAAVGSKFGIDMHTAGLEGLVNVYSQYLENLVPAGDTQLKGDEAENLIRFKAALGLTDEDAAPAHIDVARRLYRQGFETKDRQQLFEQRKAFQRLVYVSQVVFGDQKTAFLLPWRRHFQLTEAQLFVARRDNAKIIFKNIFESKYGDLKADRQLLREMKEKQVAVKMMEESAAELTKEYSRRHVEGHLTKAMAAIKATGLNKNIGALMGEMEYVLDYSRKLASMAGEEDLVPGLGPVSIQGSALAAEGKTRELKDLYKTFLEEKMEQLGEFSAGLDQDAKDLQFMLGLGAKDAQVMRDEVAAKLYRRLLKEEVASKRIDAAADPATVLKALCERVRFSPESALELHKALYRTKLASLVEQGELSLQDQAELRRIRRILCIPEDAANKVSGEISGRMLQDVVREIFMIGVKPVSDLELGRVDKVMQDLAIDPAVAQEVLAQAARERFRAYLLAAQKDREDRREFSGHIKRLVQFNSLVVTPMLERIKAMAAAKVEVEQMMAKAVEENKAQGHNEEEAVAAAQEKLQREGTAQKVLQGILAKRVEVGEEERGGQKEIVLREDVDEKTRNDVYKNFLMYTMSGDVVELPAGGMLRKKNNPPSRHAEQARLQQLGELLGMSQQEMMNAQHDMAEEAFKAQIQDVMRTGPMSHEKSTYLEELRHQLGLNKEAAEKAMRAAKSEVYGNSAVMEEGGRWTLERIKEVTKQGGAIEGVVEESTRRNIFRRELERGVTDGSGDLTSEYITKQLPELLVLEPRKLQPIVKELVQSRKRMLLVQALSQYRQKRPMEMVQSLQNLLSCVRVLPEKEPMQWNERAELRDIFQAYCTQESNHKKRDELQALLGLSDTEAQELGSASESEEGKAAHMAEEEAFF